MRHLTMCLALAGLLTAAGCSPAPPPAPASDDPADLAALGAARTAFMTAYSAGDAAAIGKLYTVDAISEPNHQATLKGRDAIVASLTNMFQQVTVKATLTPEETRTLGKAGFDRGVYKAEATPKAGGPTVTAEGRYFVLYVKDADGTWRVARDIDNAATPVVTPPDAAATDAPAAKTDAPAAKTDAPPSK
jgi:uncharacterized protein (TIGR02246 family)